MTSIQSSGDKQFIQSQFNKSSLTFSSANTPDNNIGLSDKKPVGVDSTTETTEEKLKSMQSPLDSLLSTKDNLLYDSSSPVMNNTNNPDTATDNSANIDENGVFFGEHCEKALGNLLANSPTFRELYGKINSSEGWTWTIEVNVCRDTHKNLL
jgi:hypothetical protein